jgi:hypothetical protein
MASPDGRRSARELVGGDCGKSTYGGEGKGSNQSKRHAIFRVYSGAGAIGDLTPVHTKR